MLDDYSNAKRDKPCWAVVKLVRNPHRRKLVGLVSDEKKKRCGGQKGKESHIRGCVGNRRPGQCMQAHQVGTLSTSDSADQGSRTVSVLFAGPQPRSQLLFISSDQLPNQDVALRLITVTHAYIHTHGDTADGMGLLEGPSAVFRS